MRAESLNAYTNWQLLLHNYDYDAAEASVLEVAKLIRVKQEQSVRTKANLHSEILNCNGSVATARKSKYRCHCCWKYAGHNTSSCPDLKRSLDADTFMKLRIKCHFSHSCSQKVRTILTKECASINAVKVRERELLNSLPTLLRPSPLGTGFRFTDIHALFSHVRTLHGRPTTSDHKVLKRYVTATTVDGSSYHNGQPFVGSIIRDLSQIDRSQVIYIKYNCFALLCTFFLNFCFNTCRRYQTVLLWGYTTLQRVQRVCVKRSGTGTLSGVQRGRLFIKQTSMASGTKCELCLCLCLPVYQSR